MLKKIGFGIDIGTTDIKCCLYDGNILLFQKRVLSPKTKTKHNAITFSPDEYLKICKNLFFEALKICPENSEIIVSVVSQAPSLCLWFGCETYGISYLAFYGDPTENSTLQRRNKAKKRIDYLLTNTNKANKYFFSGLTGYILYGLTEAVTMDAITAWEIGIEKKSDLDSFIQYHSIYLPTVLSPLEIICKKKYKSNIVTFIVGTTDSAVLPLALPNFTDYYIYLGTWGSVLKTMIKSQKDYEESFWSEKLHSWLLSEKNMIQKCDSNLVFLEDFFKRAKEKIPDGKTVAFCGGLVIKYKTKLTYCIDKYFQNNEIILSSDINTSMAASRLGLLREDNNENFTINSSNPAGFLCPLDFNGS